MKHVTTALMLTACAWATGASAASHTQIGELDQFAIAAKFSTLGLGAELSYDINELFSIAAGFNTFMYDYTTKENNVDYEGQLNLRTFGVFGRYHPWSNGFFLGAGLNSNGNEITLDAKPSNNSTFEFGGNSYSTLEVVNANAKVGFDGLAPQLSIGWQSMRKGVSLFTELGVMFSGEPKLSYHVTCASGIPQSTCSQLRRDVDAEKQKLQEDMDVNIWPVIALGLQYHF